MRFFSLENGLLHLLDVNLPVFYQTGTALVEKKQVTPLRDLQGFLLALGG